MKKTNVVESFNAAIEGFYHVLKTQRNLMLLYLEKILKSYQKKC